MHTLQVVRCRHEHNEDTGREIMIRNIVETIKRCKNTGVNKYQGWNDTV